jgi:hypothetical protein
MTWKAIGDNSCPVRASPADPRQRANLVFRVRALSSSDHPADQRSRGEAYGKRDCYR